MTATQARFVAHPLSPEVEQALARLVEAPDVQHVAVMPDVHLAEEVCVGVAIATTRLIYPAAVGGDIGCGMAALRFDAPADALEDVAAARILATAPSRVMGSRYRTPSGVIRRMPPSDARIEYRPSAISRRNTMHVPTVRVSELLGTIVTGPRRTRPAITESAPISMQVHLRPPAVQ